MTTPPAEHPTAAKLGELMQDRGEADTIGSERAGWFVLGVDGYFDVDNATWQEFDESDAPWDSDNFALHGHVRDLVARVADRDAALARVADDPEVIERAAREAFWTDDVGGHHKPGSRPHTWENIPDMGRENYRTLVRAVLRAALHPDPSSVS